MWGIEGLFAEGGFQSVQDIEKKYGLSSLAAQILWIRGYRSPDLLDLFFSPQLKNLPSPFLMTDMEKAVERVLEAIANEETICVYGDYDVDGTCGSAVLIDFFKSCGIEALGYQPNRFTEGYGVNVPAVKNLIEAGTRVLISVDCGITAHAPAETCLEAGVDYIVLDHHLPHGDLPRAFAIVDPQRSDDSSQLKNLCGAGIAFFFVVALRSKLREVGFFEGKNPPNLLQLLDLVAAATIADMADVKGVNRILVSHGLKVLNSSPRLGFRAMKELAKVDQLRSMHLGFVIGPRINAAGRLDSAKVAQRLLLTSDEAEAFSLAKSIEDFNLARRGTQENVVVEARVQAQEYLAKFNTEARWLKLAQDNPAAAFGPWPRAIVLANEGWHEGVLGIVASKILEEFQRPVFVFSQKEGLWKGSVRSVKGIDIFSVMQSVSVSRYFVNYGGHAHAGGASLKQEDLEDFIHSLNEHMALTTTALHYQKDNRFDLELSSEDLHKIDLGRFLKEMESFEPFGLGFPEPVIKINQVRGAGFKVMKEKHLKFSAAGIETLWFGASQHQKFSHVLEGEEMSLWVSPQWNEWQGRKKPQFRVNHVEV